MNKTESINLLVEVGWTKADAQRALDNLDFKEDPDELTIYRYASSFAGRELINRQRLQAAQKGLVTKKSKEIDVKLEENQSLKQQTSLLNAEKTKLEQDNIVLHEVKEQLEKDNRNLKNIIDLIRLKVSVEGGRLLQFEDSEIRKALSKWLKGIQG
ncbi:MAG: hypothetical protein NW214_06925 [Pseudanabaenaceae cyanobacterium bins.39]|nr:hypothetical protein [Pseudanabaenaceae cyanobacterium bins.39]